MLKSLLKSSLFFLTFFGLCNSGSVYAQQHLGHNAGSDVKSTATKAAVMALAFSEDFEYEPETQLMDLTGWAHNGGTFTSRPITVTSGGLSYQNLLGSNVGNAIVLQATGQGLDKAIGTTFTEGSVYTSMLVNVSDAQDGNYFFYLNPTQGATNWFGRIFARKSSEGKINFGLGKQSTVTWGTQEYNMGQTYLLVMKFTFVEGSNNDLAELFVNPQVGDIEPAEATITAGLVNADPADGIGAFGFRQVQLATAPTLTLDALKIGSTWQAVTPAGVTTSVKADIAGIFSVWPNPTNGTVTLQVPDALKQQGKITVALYSLLGEQILETTGTEQWLNQQFSEKLSAAASGIYLVRLQAGSQTFQTRIIKN